MGKSLTAVLITLVVILLGAASYLIFQNQKLLNKSQSLVQSPTPTTMPLTSPSAKSKTTPSPDSSPSPSAFQPTLALTQNAIKTNVNAKNYQGLIPYMTTPKVFVVLEATECCGDKTPEEAASQMSYIDQGLPFDFNQESEIVKNLKTKNPPLEKSFIGISKSNDFAVAFNIDNENHISHIEMSASWKLYNQ